MSNRENAQIVLDAVLRGDKPEGFTIDWTLGNSKNGNDSLGRKIAAFATEAGGWLVLGLDDDPRQIVGIEREQEMITRVGEVLRLCNPIPQLGDPEIFDKEGRKVAVYRVPSLGGALCEYKVDAYHRVQDSAKKMTTKDIAHYLSVRGQLSWEQCASTALREAIDDEELGYYLKKVNERNPLDSKTTEAFLVSNRAISDDRKTLTNLGVIALAKRPSEYLPQCKIQMVRFRGVLPADRIAAYLAEFPARRMISACIEFLRLNLPVRERYEGIERVEEPIIPEKALREAVVNMVVHRDYNDPQESLIRIFDDRVEFQNAGAPGKDELYKILTQGIPFHRNQGIYNFLRPVHHAEAAGQGIAIMRKELGKAGLDEPEITSLYNIFHLTMRFSATEKQDIEHRILAYGRKKKELTTTDIIDDFDISRPTAIRILDLLVFKGFAKHTGSTRDSRYIFE